ncbi:MAG TPA: hypothetical protein VM573_09000 [Actinomycetota bacterium]|jgi:hypothetical protein|nr:hypothetical protein [Actinomycetota bacterium]
MAKAQDVLYAVVGAGDFAVAKVKDAGKLADRKVTSKLYKDFVKRGKTLTTKIKSSAATKQAVEQSKTARSQVKAAATSVGKAVRANTRATKSAASKTAKAS